jgi:alkylhydroperoxidase/carboxymuconolactone decarboxylase family protein YurZ
MSLSAKDARLAGVCVAIVLGDWEELGRLRGAAPEGEPDREWREAVLQTHLFAGFPRLVEAYEVLDRAGGLGVLDDDERRGESDQPSTGRALFARIYADQAEPVMTRLRAHHGDFADWIEGHAYGRVLARPGLDAGRRELLAVACLMALGQERQLASHARGALRCGASREEVLGVVSAVAHAVDAGRVLVARGVLERFLS